MAQPRPVPRDRFLSKVPSELRITGVEVDTTCELGRGSDAVVYAGRWQGSSVAVKVLHKALLSSDVDPVSREALHERFLGECKRLHSLRHPSIVKFLGVCTHAGLPAMVTERVDSTIRSRYGRSPKLAFSDELRVLTDTASALAYIHSQGLLHRDLTARNVLVTADGRVKLADVGAARSMPQSDKAAVFADVDMTRVPGTLAYMSPEAIGSDESVAYNQQMDVFSFGVLMTEVLIKREPSSEAIFSDRFEGPRNCRQAIPEIRRRANDMKEVGRDHPLYSLIVQCLDNCPQKRPTSAQLRDLLAAHLDEIEKAGMFTSSSTRSPMTRSASAPLVEEHKRSEKDEKQLQELSEQLADLEKKKDVALKELQEALKRCAELKLQHSATLKEKDQQLKRKDERLNILQKQRDHFATESQRTEKLLNDVLQQQPLRSNGYRTEGAEKEDFAARCARFAALLHSYDVTSKQFFGTKTPPPFAAKWRTVNSPIEQPNAPNMICDYTATRHGGYFYILSRLKDEQCCLFKTKNFDEWTELKIASNVPNCTALLSHKDHLYSLSILPGSNTFMELWRLEDETESTATWQRVANGCSPQEGCFSTMCSVGEDIVLLGCVKRDYKTYNMVLAYNTKTEAWLPETAWPLLPLPVHDALALLHSSKLNLFAGAVRQLGAGDSVPNRTVLSLPVESTHSSSSQWLTDSIPPTTNSLCGVTQIYGHIIIAGGHHPTTFKELGEVFALNPATREWIALPSMQVKRFSLQLLSTDEFLVAIGGVMGVYPKFRTPLIEILDVQL